MALLTALTTPLYEATATLRVATAASGDGVVRADDLAFSDRLVNTYRMILDTRPVRDELARRLETDHVPDFHVELPANSELVEIRATDADPEVAANAANALSQILIERVAAPRTVTIVEAAVPPGAASSPSWPLNISLAALVGLVGGMALAVVVDRRDTRLRSAADIEEITRADVLAEIPFGGGEMAVFNTGSVQEEAFRALRSSLLALERDGPIQTILVVGTRAGPQPAMVAANVAAALGAGGRSVVVVDADLRTPRLHEAFQTQNTRGVQQVLQGSATWESALLAPPEQMVSLLTAGRPGHSPGQLLASPALGELVGELRGNFGALVITAPPLLAVADAELLTPYADVVILVIERAHAREDEAARATRRLGMLNAPLVGVVVVDAGTTRWRPRLGTRPRFGMRPRTGARP